MANFENTAILFAINNVYEQKNLIHIDVYGKKNSLPIHSNYQIYYLLKTTDYLKIMFSI